MKIKIRDSTLIGGLIAASLASICCIGPIVLGLLGLTGIGLFSVFDAYRPQLIALTFILLSIGFYYTYRHKPSCETGELCTVSPSSRRSKLILWLVTFLAVGFIFAPFIIEWFA